MDKIFLDSNKPRPFDLKDKKEIKRWFIEMAGYLRQCNGMNFLDCGTDFEGRKFAYETFNELKQLAIDGKIEVSKNG